MTNLASAVTVGTVTAFGFSFNESLGAIGLVVMAAVWLVKHYQEELRAKSEENRALREYLDRYMQKNIQDDEQDDY